MDSAKKLFYEIILKSKTIFWKYKLKDFIKSFFRYIFSKRFVFSHYFMMTLIFLLTLTSIFLFYSRFRLAEAGDSWFNDLWTKRQKVVITNFSNTQVSNFIAEASIPGGSLISSGFLNTDCSDIRVVDSSLSILDHWVDPETCDKSVTKIYFKIPILFDVDDGNNGNNTFFIYYGNLNASLSTVAQTSLFVATVPNLQANYSFDFVSNNVVPDKSGLGNDGVLVDLPGSKPDGSLIINNSTFPEGYSKNAYFFNGHSVVLSSPIEWRNLTKAYTLLTFIKPEGTRANGYMVQGESMGKMFNFENIKKGGVNPCTIDEYQEGDGVGSCFANGLRYTPDSPTQKKTGTLSYFYDFYLYTIPIPFIYVTTSNSVTFNGTTQSLFNSNPVAFTPLLTTYKDYGYFYKIKPYGNPGDVRTIHSWGITSPGNFSYSIDYNICSDGSLRFILDYENSRTPSSTLATPCLNNVAPSTKISSNAGKYAIYANNNKWLDLTTAHFENKRYIFVNGVLLAQDSSPNVFIERQNVPAYLGRASNSTKSNFKGEIDEFNNFGQDLSWFRGAYYTSGNFNTSISQLVANLHKKSYVIFGNTRYNFVQAGFANFARSRYPSSISISNFNYNVFDSNIINFCRQYGCNIDGPLNTDPSSSFISPTFDLFNGRWYRYFTDFDSTRNSHTSNYQFGSSNYSTSNTPNKMDIAGNLLIGGYRTVDDDLGGFPSQFFFGGIDDVYVYSSTLSATQITYHSSPWNGYASYGKTLWQAALSSSARGTISFSQNFPEESQNTTSKWYDKEYPFRVQVSVTSLPVPNYWYDEKYPYRVQVNLSNFPVMTAPNFQVTFNVDTSLPISEQRMNNNCSGFIVVDEFNRELPFWIENCNSRSSKFFVKMNPYDSSNPNLSESIKGGANQKLFLYYGSTSPSVGTYPPAQVFDYTIPGLEVAYNFEDNSATRAFDKSGKNVNLSLTSVPSTTRSAFGNALSFNGGAGVWSSFPYSSSTIRSSWEGITVLTWYKYEKLRSANPIGALYITLSQPTPSPQISQEFNVYGQSGPSGVFIQHRFYNSILAFYSYATGTPNFEFHAQAWKFGTSPLLKGVINNKITNSGTIFQSFPNAGPSFCIGNSRCLTWWAGAGSDTETFSGPIDEFRVFNRQLSDSELLAYTINTTIGASSLDTVNNTCNQVNNYCMRSFVTPSFPGHDLLAKYNSLVQVTTNSEERINAPLTNFQITLNLDTSTPISNQRMNNDCSGIIVVDDFNRQLPYWIENCNSRSSRFFVKMNPYDSSDANKTYTVKGGANQKLSIYYGNEKTLVGTYPPAQVFDYTIPNLYIAYSFDDNTSNLAFDKSGNGLHLTLTNTTTTPDSVFGNAALFNGSSSYGSRPFPDATIRSSWSGITTLQWVKPQGLNTSTLRSYFSHEYVSSLDQRYLAFTSQGSGFFTIRNQFYAAELSGLNYGPFSTNTYNNTGIAWEFGSGKFLSTFYNQNISSTANSTLYQSYPNTGDGLFIGNFCCVGGFLQYFSGPIDEIRIFSRRITDTEIRAYTLNTAIGSGSITGSNNTCNQVNNYCMRSFVTPSFPGHDLLAKYNSRVQITSTPEERINSPFMYLKFNEGKGLFTRDSTNRISSSALGDFRTLNIPTGEEPSWTREEFCIEGDCLYFDGLNDHIEIATTPGGYAETFFTENSNYSFSFWVRPLSNPNSKYSLVSFGETSDNFENYSINLDNKMRLYTYSSYADSMTNSSAATLPINKWSHVTYVYDNDNLVDKFYINGVLDSSAPSIGWADVNNPFVTEVSVASIPNASVPGLNVNFNLNTSSLISGGKLKSNCSGIIVKDDFNRTLPFWVENCNSTTSRFHVRMNPDTYRGGANQKLYVYYGNLSLNTGTYPPAQVFDYTIPNLYIAYTFDDNTSNLAFDKSGNGLHLNLINSSTTNNSVFGNALLLNGSTSYGSRPLSDVDIRSGWSGITTLQWVKPQGLNLIGDRLIYSHEYLTAVNQRYFHIYTVQTVGSYLMSYQIYGPSAPFNLGTYSTDEYALFGLAWEFGQGKVISGFYNSNIVSSSTGTLYQSYPNTENRMFIGTFCCPLQLYFSGPTDEFRIFSRKLTDTEIRAYTLNTTIGSGSITGSNNTCNQVNNYCMRSFVTPSFPGTDLLGKYNSRVVTTVLSESRVVSKFRIGASSNTKNYTDYFRGYMDEFKFYKTDITDDDVLLDYRKGLGSLKYNLSADQDTVSNFNLMAYYPFDEFDRQVAFDYSPNRMEATYLNTSNVNTQGIFNNAYSAPGTSVNTLFRINNSMFVNLTSQVTFSIWANISTNSSGYLLYKGGVGGFNIFYNSSTNKYSADICGSNLVSKNNFTSGVWDNIVVTSNSKKAKLFVNSVLEDEEFCFNNYVGSSSNTNSIYIGGDFISNSNSIKGRFDEFKIFDNYLTNSQVKLMYTYKPVYSAYGANATAFYKLDASAGTTTAVDASGNNNTLAMSNSAVNQNSWSTFGKIGNSYNFVTRASNTLNMLSASSSTLTTGLTRPHTMMAWVAFSEPFYNNYSMGYEPFLISIGSANAGQNYSALTVRPTTHETFTVPTASRQLNVGFFFYKNFNMMNNFSSPNLYLTNPSRNPVWYHVAATFDGKLRRLFINGELVTVDENPWGLVSIGSQPLPSLLTSAIALGSSSGNHGPGVFQYMGFLDEAKIYNYARTQEQIQMDMRNSGTSPALNSTFYNSIRSNQKPTPLSTSGDATIYPLIDIGFDSYFGLNSNLLSRTPVILDEIVFNNMPLNVSNYQVQFTIPISSYNASYFSHANCANLLLTDEDGRRVEYWAEPGSCAAGKGSVFAKFPISNNPQYLKVAMDPGLTATGNLREYKDNPEDVFDTVLPGLEVAYTFEDDSTTTSFDKSGNGRNLTKSTGTPTTPLGAYGNSLNLNGTSHYGSAPINSSIIRSSWPGITTLMWFKPQGTNQSVNRNLFTIQDVLANQNRFLLTTSLGANQMTLNTHIYGYSQLNRHSSVTSTNYVYHGVSWEFGSGKFIKSIRDNNILSLANGTAYLSFPNTQNALFVGVFCCSFADYFTGPIDEVRVFNRALSDIELRAYRTNTDLGSGAQDSVINTCNFINNWCTKSFVTPSYPGTDLLGKYNSRVFPSHTKIDQPVFSLSNNGVIYADGEGVRGGAAYFSFSGSEISLDLTSDRFIFSQTSDVAISFYINPVNINEGSIASSNDLKINKLSGNQIQLSGPTFNLISTRTLPTNSWSHVLFQKNGQSGVFELIIDNELQGAAYSATGLMNMSNFKFTSTENSEYYLDEFKLYDTVLSPLYIFNLYNNGGFGIKLGKEDNTSCVNGSSSFCSGPVDEFLFNETSGTTANNSKKNRSNLDIGIDELRGVGLTGKSVRFRETTTLSSDLINTNNKSSFSFWFKEGGSGTIFNAEGLELTSSLNDFSILGNSLTSIYPGSAWNDFHRNEVIDPWHHVSVNYDTSVSPATYSFYLDGVFLNQGTFTEVAGPEFYMSAATGYLDNLKFYDFHRDQAQVSQEYARGRPFAYFKLDECSGTQLYNSNSHLYKPLQFRENGTRTDAQGFLNTGLNLSNPVSSVYLPINICQNGKFYKSVVFDGENYLVGNDYHSRIYNSEGSATITFWINPSFNTSQNVNLIGSLDGTDSHLIKLINKDISIYLNKSASTTLKLTGTTDIAENDWTHVAVVFENGSNYKIYINGKLDSESNGNFESVLNTCNWGRPVVCSNNPFVVGKGFEGKLDEIKIYNYPLTQKQIRIDMNQDAAIRFD